MKIPFPFLARTLLAILAAAPLHAHNAGVHRDMTDRAWEIMIALSENQLDLGNDPELAELAQAADRALRKFQGLPAGLPPPKQSVCADPEVIKKFTSSPNWGAPADFKQMTLGAVRFPLTTTYITGNDCGIDADWSPGAFFDGINTPTGTGGRDLTGVVLGFWSHQPDDEEDDWHVYFRLGNMGGFSYIKDYLEGALGAGAGTVWVTVRCTLECVSDFLGLGGDCEGCLDDAIAEAGTAVHEGVSKIDGLFPGAGDHTSIDSYTGMGHHLNVAPPGIPGPWKLNPSAYDDRPGLLIENAGPIGLPDSIEFLSMGFADLLGMTVHYDPSLGPKRYETTGAIDFHPDSIHRGEDDWELLSFPHTPFTPLDNLAFHGWRAFRDDPRANVPLLGWALHAFGDAIVPMHVTGTFGWGHRPYEDAFENRLGGYLMKSDRNGARDQALRIARSAAAWRRIVRDWRARHPQRGMDVPVRDMVTQLAEMTLRKAQDAGLFLWPFSPGSSALYAIPGPGEGLSIALYEIAPGADPVNRNLLEEGIAAELAFLVSAAEVLP